MTTPTDEEIEEQYEVAMSVSKDPHRYDETRAKELREAQLMLDKRLAFEIKELRQSIDDYRGSSKRYSRALILLSFVLLVLSLIRYLGV